MDDSSIPYFNDRSNSFEFWYNIFHNLQMHNNNRFYLRWGDNSNNYSYIFMPGQYKIKILDNIIELSLYGITAQTISSITTKFLIWFYKCGEETQMFN